MWAAPGRRCTTGSSPTRPEVRSSCVSRTPTPPATLRSGPRGSCRRWTGSGSARAATRARTSFAAVAPVAQPRITVLAEIVSYVDFLFLPEPIVDEAAWAKAMKDGAGLLDAAIGAFEAVAWEAGSLKAALEAVGAERGLKLGKTQAPVRVAVTGRSVGLPLFESLEVLGRDRGLARLRAARDRVNS